MEISLLRRGTGANVPRSQSSRLCRCGLFISVNSVQDNSQLRSDFDDNFHTGSFLFLATSDFLHLPWDLSEFRRDSKGETR